MKNQNDSANELSNLRQKAEMQLPPIVPVFPLSEADSLKLIHELEVHQIELEMQLGELALAKNQFAESAAQKYAELYDFAPLGYFTLTKEGEIDEVNICGSQMLGKERSHLIGSRLGLFVTNDTKPKFNRFLEETFNSKTKKTCEITLSVNDNQTMYVQIDGIVSQSGEQCLLTLIDITERKRAEETLIESEKRYRMLFENSLTGILINYPDGKILAANPEACRLLGRTEADICQIGRKGIVDLTNPNLTVALEKRRKTGHFQGELTYKRGDGTVFPIDIESGIFTDANEQDYAYSFFQDITERKQAENTLVNQQELLSKLTKFSIHLSMLSPDDNLEMFVCKQIKEYVGAVGVLFSEYDQESKLISPKHIELEASLLNKVVSRLGNQIQDMRSVIDEATYQNITTDAIVKYDSLTEATFGTISRSGGAILSMILKAERYIGVSYMVDGKLYGTSLLAMDKNQPDPPIEFLENIASLVAISLRRKRAEEALKISLDRNKALLGANPDLMFVFDSACRIIDFHTESIDQLYVKPEFFLNKSIDEVFSPEISQITHRCVNAVLSTGRPNYSTYELPSGDTLRSFESRYVLCGKNEVLSIVRDITDRKLAEQALLNRKQQYDNLVAKIPVGVYILHSKPDGAFALDYASPRMAEMLGLSVEGLLADNQTIFNAIHPDDVDGFRTLSQDGIYKHRPFNWKGRILAGGNMKWMHFMSTPEMLKNGDILWHGLIVDITERKLAEEEIKLKNEELSNLVAEKDRFFSIVAHDLRSPFNVLLGLTQLLDEDLPNMELDKTQKLVSILRGSALSVYNLLENLLEWSRIKRGNTSFDPESFLLTTKIDEFLQPVFESANKKLIEISYSIPDDLVVFADQNMMGSIIRNLASNAVKFTPKNGKVFLLAQVTEDQSIEISVKDSGIGMNKSILNKLFNIDRNNNRRGTDGESSSGLGLIICKEFAEKHGGHIRAESLEGKGSTFYLTLPHSKKVNE